jgi:hypothetical protein
VYLDNVVALALGLEGYPDPPQEVVGAAVTARNYTGYVSPEFKPVAVPTVKTSSKKTPAAAAVEVVEPPAPDMSEPTAAAE